MPIKKSEVSKFIPINLPSGLSADEREELFGEIGDYVVASIHDYVGDGKSPVSGKAFKTLNKKYADDQKGGDRSPNLELNGDMMDSISFTSNAKGIKVGVFDKDQAIKAYGHNTGMEGHPWLDGITPARQFIPNPDEDFAPRIKNGIDEIIEEFMDGRKD